MGDSVGGGDSVIGGGLRVAFGADFVWRLVHEGLERVVEGDHEVGMMNRRLSSREDGSERLISVCENVSVFVAFPNVEDFGDIQIVRIFVLFAKILHERALESDFIEAVLVGFLSGLPILGIFDHFFMRWKLNVSHNHVTGPHGGLIEHGVCVILILGSYVEQLVVAAVQEKTAFVQVGREQSIPAFESEFIGKERIGMKISSAEKDGINMSGAAISERDCVAFDVRQQRTLFDRFGPVVTHWFCPPGADDMFGSVFDTLKCDVFGGIRSADEKQSFAFELAGIAEVMSVHHTAGELFDSGECGDVRRGIMARGDNDVGEALSR